MLLYDNRISERYLIIIIILLFWLRVRLLGGSPDPLNTTFSMLLLSLLL